MVQTLTVLIIFSYPPDNHHGFDVVYWREGDRITAKHYWTVLVTSYQQHEAPTCWTTSIGQVDAVKTHTGLQF